MSQIRNVHNVLQLVQNDLRLAVENFTVLYLSEADFEFSAQAAWEEIDLLFLEVLQALQGKEVELSKVGLTGNQLKFKLVALERYQKEFEATWKDYKALTKPGTTETSPVKAAERQKRTFAKKASALLGNVFGQSDTVLDSLVAVVPFAHPIKEFKETLDSHNNTHIEASERRGSSILLVSSQHAVTLRAGASPTFSAGYTADTLRESSGTLPDHASHPPRQSRTCASLRGSPAWPRRFRD